MSWRTLAHQPGICFAAGQPPVVDGGDVAAVDRDWLAFDAPAEPGAFDRLGDGRWGLVEDGAESVPGGFADGEHRVVAGDSCGHDPLLVMVAPLGAGPVGGEGRTPGWRAMLAPPAGSRTEADTSLLLGRDRLGLVDRLVGRGELRATGGELVTEPGVLGRPARPHRIEIPLCLVELLDGQLADPLLDALQP